MKNRKINFIKLGIFLFGITFILWNCTVEEQVFEQNEISIENVKTVSFKDAINLFNSKNQRNSYAKKGGNSLEVIPDWNTLEHNEIAYTEAKLTTASSKINRKGNYSSQLYFININGYNKNVIFTLYKDKVDGNGNVINARVFFNDLQGEFINGYIIENGKFTKRYVVQENVQKASVLPLFFFQNSPEDCWNTDTLGDFEGGVLDEVVLTVSGNGGGGTEQSAGHSSSYNWYYTSGPGSSGYINGATTGEYGGSTGGGGGSSLTSGQITSAAAAILMVTPIDPDEEGKCPEGFKLNPTTGKCESICTGGKYYDATTKKCKCPEGMVEDNSGNCLAIPTPCETALLSRDV